MLGHMSFSSAERAKMVALFHKLGPDAPTLCEGWTTRDLAVHLWVRENRPDAAAGMFIPQLQKRLESAMQVAAARDFDELVDAWGRGAKKTNPMRYVDSLLNLTEHFIHHEDIRRANGMTEPRDFSKAVEKELHKGLKMLAPRMLSKSAKSVVMYPEGLARIVVGDSKKVAERGDDVVRVLGPVSELVLWTYGRDASDVKIEGDNNAIVRSGL